MVNNEHWLQGQRNFGSFFLVKWNHAGTASEMATWEGLSGGEELAAQLEQFVHCPRLNFPLQPLSETEAFPLLGCV